MFALLFLGNNVGEGEAPAAAWNTAAGLGHETWPQGGGKVRPRDVASKSEERCVLAYAFFTFDLIPTSHYSRRTKDHCRTTVAAAREQLRAAGLLLQPDLLERREGEAPAIAWNTAGRCDQLWPAGLLLPIPSEWGAEALL